MQVRTTKTASGSTAVQVVDRFNQRTKIIKHIGSAKDAFSLENLMKLGRQYIRENNNTTPLFPELVSEIEQKHLVSIDHLVFTNTYHAFAYEFFSFFYTRNGFDVIENPVLKDLAIMRLVEPASKQASLALLKEYFGHTYGHTTLYKSLRLIRQQKDAIEQAAISYAKHNLAFDFSLVFYDVTTLYFETFKQDADVVDEKGTVVTKGLRAPGFSKDNKPLQPQIMIGLVVNGDGYPISIEMFSGRTFEGHTMLPMICNLQEKYNIKTLTVVADAGMLNSDNIQGIKEVGLNYVVGARLGNVTAKTLKEVSMNLNKTEGVYFTTETKQGTLICDYSKKRAVKDRSDRKKQLKRAQTQIDNPKKTKRKARFVTEETKAKLILNQALIEKDELKEGIKGYYTNLTLDKNITPQDIVARYKDLWNVEKSFRIAKSDLEARPIFHHKQESIKAHILIVFVSLCLAKSIELLSHLSIKKVTKTVWPVLDIEFKDTLTNKTFIKRMDITENSMAQFVDNFTR